MIGDHTTAGPAQATRRRALVAASIGNTLEWFDWTLYGTLSAYIAGALFDPTDPTAGLLQTLAVFAVGFVARPVGGLLFGRLGDRIGRRTTMIVTMTTLAVSSTALAFVPGFESAGVLSAVLLVVLRLVQGLAHGGEVGVSSVYVAEIAPPARRGLWSSAVYIGLTAGVMLATAVAGGLLALVGAEAMADWGWRVGFVLGGVLGIFALYLRRNAIETDAYAVQGEDATPDERPRARQVIAVAVRIAMFSVGLNVTYYVWITFAPTDAISRHGMDPTAAFAVSLAAQALMLGLLPVIGRASDRFGRRPFVFAQGIGMIALAFPIAGLVTHEPWTLFVAQFAGLVVWGLVGAVYSALLAEQVPTRQRTTVVSVVTSLGVAVFGGTGPYLNTWLNDIGYGWIYTSYIMLLGCIVVVAGFLLKETRGVDLAEVSFRAAR